MRRNVQGLAILLLITLPMLMPFAEGASLDYDVTEGHFYSQANGQGGAGGSGFTVSNTSSVPFWTEFRRYGGVDALGYPVSQRFEWRGTTVQAMQKVVLQWQPGEQRVSFVNVFDELSIAGKDDWLRNVRSTPRPVWVDNESKLAWPDIVRARQAFLDPSPAIKARYFSVPDPLRQFGLPSSRVEDMGNAYVVRLQRAVIQQWKIDTPWARSGDVTVANGGDIAKEAGAFPALAVSPEVGGNHALNPILIPTSPGQVVVTLDPGHGGSESGPQYRFADGVQIVEKAVNLQVTLKAAEYLRAAGYKVVLTRTDDVDVNKAKRDLNNSGTVNLSDELQARVDVANAAKSSVFVSIHHNGLSDPNVRGTEVYYDADRPFVAQNRRLAEYLQKNLTAALRSIGYNTLDRGIRTDSSILRGEHFFLLSPASRTVARPSAMPASLGEALFVTNPSDAAQLRRPEVLDALARGYAAGVAQFHNQ